MLLYIYTYLGIFMIFEEKNKIKLLDHLDLIRKIQSVGTQDFIDILTEDETILTTILKANDLPDDFFEEFKNREHLASFLDSAIHYYLQPFTEKKN